MQSNPSQMTPKTKAADRSSSVTETDTSMARAPAQEPVSPDASVQPSTNAHKTSHQHTKSQGQNQRQAGRGRLHPIYYLGLPVNRNRGEENNTQETSRETGDADVQDSTSPQQMNRRNNHSTRSGKREDSGHRNRHGQVHDERGGANVPENVDNGGTNEGERGEEEKEVREAEGNELSTSRRPPDPARKLHNKRESARDAIFRLEGDRRKSENDGTSSQQMNRNISNTHSKRGDNSGRHSNHGQTREKRRDANVREEVYDEGANDREDEEGGREVKEEGGDEHLTNQGLLPSNPAHRSPWHRRGSTRDATMHSGRRGDSGRHSSHGQIHDERGDANSIREEVYDEGANDGEEEEGEREVKEAESNEPSTNQGRRPSNPAHRSHRRESARDAIFRLEGTLRRRERDVNVLTTRNEELSDEIKTLKEELVHLRLERDQTDRLLHERTVELSSAQLFLGKADTVSVTDVSRMVDMLNAEISQASNLIADSLSDNQVTLTKPDTTELNRLLHKERSSIGACLCDILARRLCQPGTEFDPMITQLALQAGLSKACCLIINSWNPPFWDSSSTVDRMYINMRPLVGQVIAGRWRALARTYLNGQDSEDGIQEDAKKGIQEANANYLISTLGDLLTIVGWSPGDSHQDLPSGCKEKMRFLSDKALELHETIGQGITSKDLIVDIISCETPFDPTKMDNADRQRGKPDAIPDGIVACTVELGLKYSAKSVGDLEETGVILKPKVLLTSVLVEEDTPPKPQD